MQPILAASLVLILIVHESGHYFAALHCGYPPRLWLHIPFFGARMEAHKFRSCEDEAFIAYGGPFLGALCSLVLFVLWLTLPLSPEWRSVLYIVSFASALLNLFNLIPLLPLDGGRIVHTIFPRTSLAVGFAALLAVSFFFKGAAFLVVWILVVGYVPVSPLLRFRVACVMFAAMPILMWLGYRSAYLWEDGIYLAFGLLLVKTIHTFSSHPETEGEEKGMTEMSERARSRWAWRYSVLVVSLAVLLGAHITLFPFFK
jgi:Zn-dependent protease